MTTLHQSCLWVLFLVLEPMLICHFDASNCDASPVAAAPNLNFIPLSPISSCTCHSVPLAIGKGSKNTHLLTIGLSRLTCALGLPQPKRPTSRWHVRARSARSNLLTSAHRPPHSSTASLSTVERGYERKTRLSVFQLPMKGAVCRVWVRLLVTFPAAMVRLSMALHGLSRAYERLSESC